MRRGARTMLAAVVVTVGAAVAPAPPAGAFPGPAPPGPVPAGQPGADGPCSRTGFDRPSPVDAHQRVWVFEPAGTGAPATTGGRCDDAHRPVVLVAHGYATNVIPIVYDGLIRHLVSHGFVVVYPGYSLLFNPPFQYRTVDAGFRVGVEASGRVDVDHVGLVGHSFGGGMVPRMTQLVAERGWGTRSLWAAMLAPFYSYQVGGGPIALPVHARVLVSGYEHDVFVDHRIAIETFRALGVPDDHKRYTVVLGERRGRWNLGSDHLTPLSLPVPLPLFAEDALDRYGIFRPVDGLARCARWGEWCDLDLTDMGTWSDGAPFRAAISTDDPVDLGPPAIECDFLGGLLNPRPCP